MNILSAMNKKTGKKYNSIFSDDSNHNEKVVPILSYCRSESDNRRIVAGLSHAYVGSRTDPRKRLGTSNSNPAQYVSDRNRSRTATSERPYDACCSATTSSDSPASF